MLIALFLAAILLELACALVCDVPTGHSQLDGFYIQQCINKAIGNNAANVVVSLRPGRIYQISMLLSISGAHNLTFNTEPAPSGRCGADSQSECATLQATAGLNSPFGLFFVHESKYVTFDSIIVDGNRNARLKSTAGQFCKSGGPNRTYGFNMIWYCESCQFINSVSMNALCGSGLQVHGTHFTASLSLFMDNGDNVKNFWSNGLSCFNCTGGNVVDCFFQGNTDSQLLIASGPVNVTQNVFISSGSRGCFNGIFFTSLGRNSNFVGSLVSENSIECGGGCCFGIQIGARPFQPATVPILGLALKHNNISGAGVQVNCQGAGTEDYPIVIAKNTLGQPPLVFFCKNVCNGAQPGSSINVFESMVTLDSPSILTDNSYCT